MIMPCVAEYRGTGIFIHFGGSVDGCSLGAVWQYVPLYKMCRSFCPGGPLTGIYPIEIVAHRHIELSTA